MSLYDRKKAYRSYIKPVVSGSGAIESGFLSRVKFSNNFLSNAKIGNKNVVDIKSSSANNTPFSINIEDDNRITIAFSSEKLDTGTINIGSGNFIDANISSSDMNIQIGNSNYIRGNFNPGLIKIGDNNILVDFNGTIEAGTNIYTEKNLGSLMFRTKVTDYFGEGSEYIEVEETSLIAYNQEIKFGTVASAFATRKVTKVIGNRVYIDQPLSAKEATYPGATVFNEQPVKLEEYNLTTSAESKNRTKRIPLNIDNDINLHLRDIIVDGSFKTKIFFVTVPDNIAIVKNLLPQDYPAGTQVKAPGYDPYSSREYNILNIDASVNSVEVDSIEGIFIGRVLKDSSNNEYIVTGFDGSNIFLDDVTNLTDSILHGDKIDFYPESKASVKKVAKTVSANTNTITLDDASGLQVGNKIKIERFNDKRTIVEINGNDVVLDKKIMPDELNSVICYGKYIIDRNLNRRQFVESVSSNIYGYLFGEGQ